MSIRQWWKRLCAFMNRNFPENVLFPRYQEETIPPMATFAVIKRRTPLALNPNERCDRCPQRAQWRVKVSPDTALTLCGHHYAKHKGYIEDKGYEVEPILVPDPVDVRTTT